MLKTILIIALVVGVNGSLFLRVRAQDFAAGQAIPISTLSPLEQLQAENHLLKVHVAQLSAQLADVTAKLQSVALTEERAKLVEAFRKTMKADADAEFDWQHLVFVPKAPHAPTTKP